MAAFKFFWIAEGSWLILFTIYTLYRVVLIVWLKRVIEINEDIILRIITVSVFGIMGYSIFCLVPGIKFNSVVSAVSEQNLTKVSIFSCDHHHPMAQR